MAVLVGYVIMDRRGLIRVQRVDLHFGAHGPQIVETLRVIVATYR